MDYVEQKNRNEGGQKRVSGNGKTWKKLRKALKYQEKSGVEKPVDNVDNSLATFLSAPLMLNRDEDGNPGLWKVNCPKCKKIRGKILRFSLLTRPFFRYPGDLRRKPRDRLQDVIDRRKMSLTVIMGNSIIMNCDIMGEMGKLL